MVAIIELDSKRVYVNPFPSRLVLVTIYVDGHHLSTLPSISWR